jgi:hypothetical protein
MPCIIKTGTTHATSFFKSVTVSNMASWICHIEHAG